MTSTIINTTVDKNSALRACYVTIYIDISGSMQSKMKDIECAVRGTMQDLSKSNDSAEDIIYLVKLVTFNDKVHVFNTEYLEPQELLDLLPENFFIAHSTTDIAAMLDTIDADFSGSGKDLHTGDPYPFNLIITDWEATENVSAQKAAQKRLAGNNRFNQQAANLCLYCGDESHKEDASAIVGAENLVALSPSLMPFLTPILANSTIVLSATHMADDSGSVSQMNQIIDDVEDGATGADALRAELEALFN
jgi:hypothetical protein